MAVINEPKYDEDVVNLGYLKRVLGLSDTDAVTIIVTKNYGTAPNPPYNLNDTYMYNGKVYICIKARKIGEFNHNDWILMADNSALGDYATNTNLNNAVGQLNQKIESTATGINIEVAKKLNASDFTHANIVLAINDNTSSALINANKINLSATDILNLLAGNSINLSSKNISINSNNFNVDIYGNCTANSFSSNNANITGGKVNIYSTNDDYEAINIHSSNRYSRIYPGYIYQEGANHQLTLGRYATDGGGNEYYGMWLRNKNNNKQNIDMTLYTNGSSMIRVANTGGTGFGLDSENGVVGVSDKRKKHKIKSISNDQSKNIIEKLRPVTYKFKKGKRVHRGFIAQEVEKALNVNGIKDQVYTIDEKGVYQLIYDELLADLVGCNQYLIKKIDELENKIKNLENK